MKPIRPDQELDRDRALAEVCRRYWNPLYAYARQKGVPHHQAEDLAQSFFVKAIERDLFAKADATKGRLRTFLLTAFQRLMWQEWHKQDAAKRGGATAVTSLEEMAEHGSEIANPSATGTPEEHFHREWAAEVMKRALAQLSERHFPGARQGEFRILTPFLAVHESGIADIKTAAKAIGLSEGALRVRLHRVRRLYRRYLRDEVSLTLVNPSESEIDDELRSLIATVS